MGCNVFANGDEISCKAGGNKVIAAFPDVCLTPPPPPAGPLPIPYPNTSFSKDMKEGSKSVQIKGEEVMLKDSSYYKTSPLGNEAATKGQGAGVVSHTITGATYFVAWSMDVKFEGDNVDRHSDLTTSNHASQPGNVTKVDPSLGDGASADIKEEVDECPCCHTKPAHPHQKDPATGKMYEKVKEKDWYAKGMEFHDNKVKDLDAAIASKTWSDTAVEGQIRLKQSEARQATDTIAEARTKLPPCPNLHDPPDEGCGTHFVRTSDTPGVSSKAERSALGFNDAVRRRVIREHKSAGASVTNGSPVAHKTPLAAGGCPNDSRNLIPTEALSPECKAADDAQGKLQGISAQSWRS